MNTHTHFRAITCCLLLMVAWLGHCAQAQTIISEQLVKQADEMLEAGKELLKKDAQQYKKVGFTKSASGTVYTSPVLGFDEGCRVDPLDDPDYTAPQRSALKLPYSEGCFVVSATSLKFIVTDEIQLLCTFGGPNNNPVRVRDNFKMALGCTAGTHTYTGTIESGNKTLKIKFTNTCTHRNVQARGTTHVVGYNRRGQYVSGNFVDGNDIYAPWRQTHKQTTTISWAENAKLNGMSKEEFVKYLMLCDKVVLNVTHDPSYTDDNANGSYYYYYEFDESEKARLFTACWRIFGFSKEKLSAEVASEYRKNIDILMPAIKSNMQQAKALAAEKKYEDAILLANKVIYNTSTMSKWGNNLTQAEYDSIVRDYTRIVLDKSVWLYKNYRLSRSREALKSFSNFLDKVEKMPIGYQNYSRLADCAHEEGFLTDEHYMADKAYALAPAKRKEEWALRCIDLCALLRKAALEGQKVALKDDSKYLQDFPNSPKVMAAHIDYLFVTGDYKACKKQWKQFTTTYPDKVAEFSNLYEKLKVNKLAK